MSLSADLLSQADTLARNEPKRPRQASLRRAVSAAYYAVFHMLIDDATRSLCQGRDNDPLRSVLARAFDHSVMKKAAQSFADANLARPWKGIIETPSPELQKVAAVFIELQNARHQADYDLSLTFARSEVIELVGRAREAADDWRALRRSDAARGFTLEARTILLALLAHGQLARR